MPETNEQVCFAFGDSPEMADALLALVIKGEKTATCGDARDFEAGGETLPQVGRRDVVLNGRGQKAAIIETYRAERQLIGADRSNPDRQTTSISLWTGNEYLRATFRGQKRPHRVFFLLRKCPLQNRASQFNGPCLPTR
ncbi:MAG: hypothetical protein JJ867_14920 [Marinobacter sp.]|nr:hypothetical protein [Marinobacter sp.]